MSKLSSDSAGDVSRVTFFRASLDLRASSYRRPVADSDIASLRLDREFPLACMEDVSTEIRTGVESTVELAGGSRRGEESSVNNRLRTQITKKTNL